MRQKQNWIRWSMMAIAALLLLVTAGGPRGGVPRPRDSDSRQEGNDRPCRQHGGSAGRTRTRPLGNYQKFGVGRFGQQTDDRGSWHYAVDYLGERRRLNYLGGQLGRVLLVCVEFRQLQCDL